MTISPNKHPWLYNHTNLADFWKMLPCIFSLDFWRVNPQLKKCNTWIDAYNWNQEYEKFIFDEHFYQDGEKYLFDNKHRPLCMCQPMFGDLTRSRAWQPDYNTYWNHDRQFLLNKNKTANHFMKKFLFRMQKIKFDRTMLLEKISRKVAQDKNIKTDKYVDSDDFLSDLYKLSMYNYFDIMDLMLNSFYSTKEKNACLYDFYSLEPVRISDYTIFVKGITDDIWTNDFIPTAKSRKHQVDSIIVIPPQYNIKITKSILERMNKKYFNKNGSN